MINRGYVVKKEDQLPIENAVVTAAKSDFMFILPALRLDVARALKRLNGNEVLYLKLLRDFIAGNENELSELVHELRTAQWENVLLRVNAIRGVAGNVEAKQLEAAALELENACRAAQNSVPYPLTERLKEFVDRYEELITDIGTILARQTVVSQVKPEGRINAAEQKSLLVYLKKALCNDEPKPCKEILGTLLQRRLPAHQQKALMELNRLVGRYQLAEALALLDIEFKDVLRDKGCAL